MRFSCSLLFCLLLVSHGSSAVITGACVKDLQCGEGMCCAVSLWIRSLRMCAPIGQKGDECHPMSHKVGQVLYIVSSLYYLTPYLTNQYLRLHLISIGAAERVLISLQSMD
uniref:Prokineticin 2 n=1 Tax=Oncorhynchus kisutch TaxID=8019 RepID=A0A8C7LAU6_ONCKI